MTPSDLMHKAARAIDSAELLLNNDDVDGACNRAYYAMFDAARAALISVEKDKCDPEKIKTHSGLLSMFSLHLVKTWKVPVDLGKALNRVGEIRLIADYTDDVVDNETAS